MKKWILALSVCMCVSGAEYLDLESAYREILLQNDGLKSAQSAVHKQEKLKDATKMIYLPQVSLDAAYMRLQEPINIHLLGTLNNPNLAPLLPSSLFQPINIQDENIIFGAINIIYPIFSGGKKYYANKLAKIALEDATLALKLKELSLFEECVKLYFGVVLANQVARTLKDTNDAHLLHYQNALKLQSQGQIAHLQALQAQVNYDKSNVNLQKAEDSLKTANIALNAILGRSSNTDLTLISSIDIKRDAALQNVAYFIEKALDMYPALRIVDNQIASANELSHVAFADFLPDVGLFGSYMISDNSSLLDRAMPRWFVGVGAKWNLLSPSGRVQKYQASKIASLEAQYALNQARKDLQTLCEQTYKQVQSYKQQYFSLHSSIELAREYLRLQQSAFLQGIATSAEVSDAQNALSLAIIERQNVAYSYAVALARLLALSDETDRFYNFFDTP